MKGNRQGFEAGKWRQEVKMKKVAMLFVGCLAILPTLLFAESAKKEQLAPISAETTRCLGCHRSYTPGIVADWSKSAHAKTTPALAMKKLRPERRMSAEKAGSGTENVVGCYECHSLNTDKHRDNFDHMGFKINVVVSNDDCATCHPTEAKEYSGSKKAHAVGNLTRNPVYHTLVQTITGKKEVKEGTVSQLASSAYTQQETCFSCHGTDVKVEGLKEVETKMGKIKVPALTNWPNQGVGRLNPDSSKGACSACHSRHSFSIEIARKPYTCAQCHLEPDVPAWNVYHESKHGNIFLSKNQQWDFNTVPWQVGRDFQAPTCAVCHNSLITNSANAVLAERTHDFGSRLWVRLFGLIYSHPQPINGDTSILKNREGLPLPASFTGEVAAEGLIGKDEQIRREKATKDVCNACHGTSWIDGHFAKLDNTIRETDSMIMASTRLLLDAWKLNLAEGLPQGKNPFDETIEQMWIRQWLFYANSVKYASAMTGAPDYAAFKNGWWKLTENLEHMREWIELRKKAENTGTVKDK